MNNAAEQRPREVWVNGEWVALFRLATSPGATGMQIGQTRSDRGVVGVLWGSLSWVVNARKYYALIWLRPDARRDEGDWMKQARRDHNPGCDWHARQTVLGGGGSTRRPPGGGSSRLVVVDEWWGRPAAGVAPSVGIGTWEFKGRDGMPRLSLLATPVCKGHSAAQVQVHSWHWTCLRCQKTTTTRDPPTHNCVAPRAPPDQRATTSAWFLRLPPSLF